MAHRFQVEAVDRLLQRLRRDPRPFGGVLIVFAGDYLQTLPVIPNKPASEAMFASV